MGSLIKRQIRKYLPEHLAKDKDLEVFLDAVTKSYSYYDEQYAMQQRVMALSSEELFAANGKLRKEAAAQKKVIDKLKRVIKTLEFYKLSETNRENIQGYIKESFVNKVKSATFKTKSRDYSKSCLYLLICLRENYLKNNGTFEGFSFLGMETEIIKCPETRKTYLTYLKTGNLI